MKKARLWLKKGREVALKKRHPWIFSGAIEKCEGRPEEGALVDVHSSRGDLLAVGHYGSRDIAVKVLAYEPIEDVDGFLEGRIRQAYRLRRSIGLPAPGTTDCYRLVNAEGDLLPGLVIDVYGETAVMQCQSPGMERLTAQIAAALARVLPDELAGVYWKKGGRAEGAVSGEYLFGRAGSALIHEHGLAFHCDWEAGQKTGFYLDQRDNRRMVEEYSAGRTVLNAFCYTGAFSVYALRGGAREVHSVDASQEALQLTGKNIALNVPDAGHTEIAADCFRFLEEIDSRFDLVILDPPAFVKHRKAVQRGLHGYQHINFCALRAIAPGGLLFTFSCSQLVDKETFRRTVLQAAVEANREVQVISELSQAGCHPVSLGHEEGSYLKGLLLYVR